MNPIAKLLITYFLGMFGVHKFIDGKTKQGVLYLCTLGLCGIGWIYDTVISVIDLIHYLKTGEIRSHNLSVDKEIPQMPYKSPSGGYMNFAVFKVVGINPATKRKNTREYSCKTEDEARDIAQADGLIDLQEITAISFDPPSEAQYAACRKHNRHIPSGACKMDVSALMTRDIEHQKPASVELMEYADSIGLKFSYLIGEESLRNLIDEK